MSQNPIKFNVYHIRLGHLTNSSSSHSMIFLDNVKDDPPEDESFGWQNFTLASSESKMAYLSQMIYTSLVEKLESPRIASLVAREVTGHKPDPEGYVDHQSRFNFPILRSNDNPDFCFIEALRDFLKRPDLVVLGGNDNSEEAHPLCNGDEFTLPIVKIDGTLYAKFDPVFKFWTIFNPLTGALIRFKLEKPFRQEPIMKASTPDFVDIKITDMCTENCKYCYQDSKPDGMHADIFVIQDVAEALGQIGVFEAAIGGGDTMSYPNLTQALRCFRDNNIVPNITTRSFSWIAENKKRKETFPLVGKVGISVETQEEAKNALSLAERYDVLDKVTLHYVVGTSTELFGIIRTAVAFNTPVVLLGYKNVGRGKNFSPYPTNWKEIVKEFFQNSRLFPRISIDTPLANTVKPEDKIPEICLTRKEGVYSIYIDAVNKLIAPSSYESTPDCYPLDIENAKESIINAFRNINP